MTDKNGREIVIEFEDEGVAIAKHNGKEIGRIEVNCKEIDALKHSWHWQLDLLPINATN